MDLTLEGFHALLGDNLFLGSTASDLNMFLYMEFHCGSGWLDFNIVQILIEIKFKRQYVYINVASNTFGV